MAQAHKFNDNNIYRVRKSSRLSQAIFLAKLIVKKHGDIQVEGMGECISLAFKIAQVLSKNGYTSIESIREQNIEAEERKEINPKITIRLKKTAQFDQLTADINLREQ